MILNKLSVLNYKNIRQAEIACSSKMNCFFGKNGMGKTNLLDAIYYLSFCKSHVHTAENQLIHRDEALCVLQGEYTYEDRTEAIFCSIGRGQRKLFKRNQKAYQKLSEHIGLLPLVMVSPFDSELIRGGSDERRRWLDVIISQYDKSYMHALIHYNKALMQRNRLLRDQSRDRSLYEVLEMQLAQHGEVIFQKRTRLVDVFLPFFNNYYQTICQSAERVGLQYLSQLGSVSLEEKLAADREREKIVGYTLTGIHKDDLEMTLNESLIRHVGSQGQNKTYLIAMKLAQFSFLTSQSSTMPILLLDDIFDKLDAERVEQIIQLVGGEQFGQIFITDTNRKYLDRMLKAIQQDYTVFKIEAGQVFRMEEQA
ncbi:DNA replication/repair protein RecF [Tannerella sp.]|uniref:DNA replication/repair protein RecF n=1 Tax=Tannerella sp. TaxID=2382127 RepID=UPI0026DAF5EF|nr:DNA replication and repair protein RecF [Tannerella sp.]MDO4704512.1 DNA replication and repair protein RecF [Tannerella sp.]